MSVHAIAGLALFNVLLLVLGACVLWAIRGWETWIEFGRFAGLSYLLGIALFGASWTLLLVVGVLLILFVVTLTVGGPAR